MVEQLSLNPNQDKEERKEYRKRKAELLEMEKGNFTKIIFMKGTKGFWISGGHSAVMLANKYGKDLGMRVPLKRDTDYDSVFKEGKIATKSLDYYKRQLVGPGVAEIEKEGTICWTKSR